jgi:hypothetical protein
LCHHQVRKLLGDKQVLAHGLVYRFGDTAALGAVVLKVELALLGFLTVPNVEDRIPVEPNLENALKLVAVLGQLAFS